MLSFFSALLAGQYVGATQPGGCVGSLLRLLRSVGLGVVLSSSRLQCVRVYCIV